jgi:hypothetical protein
VSELHFGLTGAKSYVRSEFEHGRRVQVRKLDAAGLGPAGEAFKSFICMAVFSMLRVARPGGELLPSIPHGSRFGGKLLGVCIVAAETLLQ